MSRVHDFEFFRVRWLARYGWIVDRPPAVVVVPEARDGRLWMIRIRRVPIARASWELPGGEVGRREDPIAAGLRELEEECGLVAQDGAELWPTTLEAAPGMGRMPHHVVVARGVEPRGARPEPQREEGIVEVRRFAPERVAAMIRRGQISVFATLGALAATSWARAAGRAKVTRP